MPVRPDSCNPAAPRAVAQPSSRAAAAAEGRRCRRLRAPPPRKDATAAVCGRRRCLTALGSAAAVRGRRRQGRGAPRCRFLPFFVRREHTRHLVFGKRRKGHVRHFTWLSIKINYNIEFGVSWHNNSDLGCLLANADFLNGLWQKPHFHGVCWQILQKNLNTRFSFVNI